MRRVAKIVIVDNDDNYLLMYRSDHPRFPNDSDLPGGIVEEGEAALEGTLREVVEEAGFHLEKESVEELYSGSEYSAHHTHYFLYLARLTTRPEVEISWEHSAYEWISRSDFLEKAKNAQDTYMHMVADVLSKQTSLS